VAKVNPMFDLKTSDISLLSGSEPLSDDLGFKHILQSTPQSYELRSRPATTQQTDLTTPGPDFRASWVIAQSWM
jgi:hypothetical protein